jgi:hypothetical protein
MEAAVDLAEMHEEQVCRTSEQVGPDTSLFGDIPGPIWSAFLIAWALLFGLFIVFFAGDGPATIAVVTSCFFALMTLGLPAALAMRSRHPSHGWPRTVVTRNGRIPTSAAATQILLIPFAAAIGIVAFITLAM